MENMNNRYKNENLINIDKAYELWDWADKLKVSAERLKQAVLTVGRSASAVRLFLKK
jgi:hypothetical protein